MVRKLFRVFWCRLFVIWWWLKFILVCMFMVGRWVRSRSRVGNWVLFRMWGLIMFEVCDLSVKYGNFMVFYSINFIV